MSKSVVILLVALVVALIGSYFSWTVEVAPEKNKGVTLIEIAPEDIKLLAYESEEFSLSLESRSDELGNYFWAKTRRVPKTKPTDKKTSEPKEAKTAEFKVGGALDNLLDKLAPFVAVREIEQPGADSEVFGLTPPGGVLTLKTTQGEHNFAIGKEGYGHRHVYAQDTATKKYYLLDGKLVRSVRRADNRLLERRIVDLEIADLESISIKSGESKVDFTQQNTADPEKAFWSVAGAAEKHMGAKIWIGKVLRARAISYGSKDVLANAKTAMTLNLKGKKHDYTVVFSRVGEGLEQQWFAQSQFTRGVIKLPPVVAKDIVRDIETLGVKLLPEFEERAEPEAPPTVAPVTAPTTVQPTPNPHKGHSHPPTKKP